MGPLRRLAVLLALLLVAPSGAVAAAVLLRFHGAEDPCPSAATPLVVTTRSRTLWVCAAGRAAGRYHVALGARGVGKRAKGDRKTPLGTYPLAAPRPSRGWGTFIPLGYPTAAQQRQGFTGSAVGIHGPGRRQRWLGPANAWFDWTGGCIAVPDDATLARVADVARRPSAAIEVR